MFIRVIAFLLFLAPVAFGQQPTPTVHDPRLTPGDSFPVTVQDLCVPGYTKKVRDVPAEMKREVYEEYGVTSHGSGDYEVDHLIPLELGGSNSIKNLWPESRFTSPRNAQVKDRLEGKLHESVCSGQLDLKNSPTGHRRRLDWCVSILCQPESARLAACLTRSCRDSAEFW